MIKKHIPNAITCCNLLCGCLAIIQAFEGHLVMASYLVILAAIFDFFDGFAARLLKVSSAIGKDLDSLADMVTFGVVPGILMFQLLRNAVISISGTDDFYYRIEQSTEQTATFALFDFDSYTAYHTVPYIALIIPVFSAIRLAKFNNDTRQSESFIGLPTPANGLFIISLILVFKFNNRLCNSFLSNTYFLCSLCVILSILLIVEIPLFALKFKNFKWTGNEIRFVFLGLSVLLLVAFQFLGIMLIILLYLLMSVIHNRIKKNKIHS